jgi:electron transfer flavoprotein alpha subunit
MKILVGYKCVVDGNVRIQVMGDGLDSNQTGQMPATPWDRPQATLAAKLDTIEGTATVTHEVDAGYCSNEIPVDQDGKIIAPALYAAIGISSGTIQHLAWIKDTNAKLALNKDAEAPILEIADISFTVLPRLESVL